MGIKKCKARARICVYWPSLYEAIEHEVKQCPNKYSKDNQKEIMISHDTPLNSKTFKQFAKEWGFTVVTQFNGLIIFIRL